MNICLHLPSKHIFMKTPETTGADQNNRTNSLIHARSFEMENLSFVLYLYWLN